MQNPEEAALFAANLSFYEAFSTRDLQKMDSLWAKQSPVACIHPGWDALRGRENVMASWRMLMENPIGPPIECIGPSAHFLGKSAFVICTEFVSGAKLIATNIFVKEEGVWRLVHHQAGPAAQRFFPRGGPSKEPLN